MSSKKRKTKTPTDDVLNLAQLQDFGPRDLVHDVDLENGPETAELEVVKLDNLSHVLVHVPMDACKDDPAGFEEKVTILAFKAGNTTGRLRWQGGLPRRRPDSRRLSVANRAKRKNVAPLRSKAQTTALAEGTYMYRPGAGQLITLYVFALVIIVVAQHIRLY